MFTDQSIQQQQNPHSFQVHDQNLKIVFLFNSIKQLKKIEIKNRTMCNIAQNPWNT